MPILIILTFLLAPAYAIRFKLGPVPTDILMMWVFLVWVIFVWQLTAKKQLHDFLKFKKTLNSKLLIFIGLFFVAGLTSLFVKGFDIKKLGQFLVLFLQPISIFLITDFTIKNNPKLKSHLFLITYFLLALAGLYAIFQYFTLLGLPQAYWGNAVEPKRALSFFMHPNFYALWSAPLLALLIPDLMIRVRNWKLPGRLSLGVVGEIGNWKFIIAWLLGAIGLLLSFSRAGWLGLAIAMLVYLIVAADKKIRKLALYALIVIFIVIVSIPNLRWRFVLPFYREKSTVSRLSLWETGWKGIKEAPITGLGLTGFSKNWTRLNTDPNLEAHNFPHNIFLDFWVEMGILGLISFVGITALLTYHGLSSVVSPFMGLNKTADKSASYKLAVSLFLICLLTQGLIDNPYFKNDLAMVFWLILSLAI